MKTLLSIVTALFLTVTVTAHAENTLEESVRSGQVKVMSAGEEIGKVVVQLQFNPGSTEIRHEDKKMLENIFEMANKFPHSDYKISVVTYAESFETDHSMQVNRSTTVVNHLYANGFGDAASLTATTRKITRNTAIAAVRVLNNRVEIVFTPVMHPSQRS